MLAVKTPAFEKIVVYEDFDFRSDAGMGKKTGENSSHIDSMYMEALGRASINGVVARARVLNSVFDTVKSQEDVEYTNRNATRTAGLLQKFKENGLIRGDVSIEYGSEEQERTRDKELPSDKWVVYTAYNGTEVIIDVDRRVIGTVQELGRYGLDGLYIVDSLDEKVA
jgi:hypothetical protein